MSLRINQNIVAVRTYGQLSHNADRLEKSVEKLSSGLRINRAADDAAGLAISEKLRRQIRGLSRAILNAQDGISMIQSGEGALGESHAILQRMRELAIQASNDTLTSTDRLEIQKELVQLRDDLNRIAYNTEFNTKKLLDGSQSALVSTSTKYVEGLVTDVAEGGDFTVSMILLKGGASHSLRTQIFTIKGTSSLAKGNTTLQSIAQFYDNNGTFVLENPQLIYVYGNARDAQFTIDEYTTLDDLAGLIANAIKSSNGLDMTNSRVQVITTASTKVAGMGGYIQVISGIVGESGIINFAAEHNILSALGFSTNREAINNQVKVTLQDSSGSTRTVTTSNQRASGLLDGVDLAFSSQVGQVAGDSGLEEGFIITVADGFTISTIGGTSGATFSAAISIRSGYWTMGGIAAAINEQLTEQSVSGMLASVVDGELRISYIPPLVSLSNTFYINGFDSNDAIGLTDGAKNGFTDGHRDKTKSYWGFSMLQGTITASSVMMTISAGDLDLTVTVGRTMSAVGNNQGDMIAFHTFQASVNAQLSASNVMARVDQIDDGIAFTNLRIGHQTLDTGVVYQSKIDFRFSAENTVAADLFYNKFGLSQESNLGTGDMNYRVHVVSYRPQFQIGSDQGQIMPISMANMSAKALDVDNLDLTTIQGASKAMGKINKAIDTVSAERAKLGSFQNRLEYAINNLRGMHANTSSAESRIRDVDMALEMVEFTRDQIVNQSATAMLAQANLLPQGVLQLLR